MKFKEAQITDSKSIVDFQLKMAMETEGLELDLDIVKKGVDAVFKDPNKGKYYIVEENEQIIASLFINLLK